LPIGRLAAKNVRLGQHGHQIQSGNLTGRRHRPMWIAVVEQVQRQTVVPHQCDDLFAKLELSQ